jgi:predicted amino acid-binding ACT domain protein
MSQSNPIHDQQDLLHRLEKVESLLDVCYRSLKEAGNTETRSVQDVLAMANDEVFNLVEEQRETFFSMAEQVASKDENVDPVQLANELNTAKQRIYSKLSEAEKEQIKNANLPQWMTQEGQA